MTNPQPDIARLSVDEKRALLQQLLRDKTPPPRKLPLSFAQQRLWFLDQLEPHSAVYNVPSVLRLRGLIDVERMRCALDKVIERHEALRTTFEAADDTPVQTVNPPRPVALPLVDLGWMAPDEREEEIEALVTREIRRPFDLSRDPMLRATLIRLGADEHVLVLVIHHIASDEWSMGILFREWSEFYRSLGDGTLPVLSHLPIQYRDYARWQVEWARSEECRRQLAYWKERLAGATVLQLPTDYQRPASQTFHGALCTSMLPRALQARLKEFSRDEGATLFMTLLAAFKALLHRYTQQEDITVGCPIAGRNRPETEPLIGFFVNTLALRGRVEPGQSFRQLLRQVREETLGASANQDIPFDKLVEELHPERTSTRTPFVQVFFALNHEFVPRDLFPGIRADVIEVDTGTAKFELTFVVKDAQDGLQLLAEYNTDLFTPRRIERMLNHYAELLASAMKSPDEQISRLNLLSDAERSALLGLMDVRNYPGQDCVHQLFEWQVARTPDAIALDYDGETITYRELNARANQLAHYLLQNKAGPGTLVGVYMDRSIEMIIALIAVLKSGAAYVPLDLSYPRERLAFMIEDARMPMILTQGGHLDELPAGGVQTLCVDSEWERVQQQPRQLPPNNARPDSLAYVIYTSGSTGKPKGVCVPHRAIVRLVMNTDYVTITAADRIAQASNASFDAATFEIWGALLNGARLVGISKHMALSPRDFERALRNRRITILFLTTALLNQLAREVPDAFATVGTVLFGGEAVDPKWVRAILESAPPQRLVHVYGPTENTTFSTWHLVTEIDEDAHTVPIGKPIANSELYILDAALNPVPAGIPGEIYVGGDGLARGYHERPELTALRFVPHPFNPDPEARLYRTGDLARFNDDLEVEFIGRVDQQVKLRGFRIELGEIESLLLKHPAVSETVVMVREDVPGDKRLVAYVVPRDGDLDAAGLRAFLRSHLPDYMVPAAFVMMRSFPLTPNEKLDRQSLPVPDQTRPDLDKGFIAPRDSIEEQLANIFEKILGVQPVGAADNFFELGGHSLLAVRLFSQIEKVFKRKLPLATLFRAPTVEEIAKILREDSQARAWSTIVDIQPKGSRPPFFWLHSLGGDGGGGFFYYRKLAELLGTDQPSFGIRSPQEPFRRIEDMAGFYIDEIRKFQPEGPYFLGGFCFGGNVAFEMARQLTAAGQEIGLLVVLESAPPNVSPKHSWNAAAARYSLENFVENIKDFVGNEHRMAMLKNKGRRLTEKLKRTVRPEQENRPAELKDMIDLANYPEGYVKFAETHWEALTQYHPKPYPGEIHLFRAKKQGLANFTHTLGWEVLVGERVHVNVVPGTHQSMLQEPSVQIVAARLRQLLDQAHGVMPATEGELAFA